MMQRQWAVGLALALILVSGRERALAQTDTASTPEATDPAAQASPSFTLTVGEDSRSYVLHVPDERAERLPLVIVLHGRFQTGAEIEAYTGFSALADSEGFIAAYPDGINLEWNYVRGIRGYDNPRDDVAFLVALIDAVDSRHPVDRERVYVAGFSNGGFMAQRAACEAPDYFAAVATVAAAGFGGMESVCTALGETTAPIMLVHGTADNNIPFEGLSATRGDQTVYVLYPVADTLGFWAQFNGCEAQIESSDVPEQGESPGTSVVRLAVVCSEDTAVILYAVSGGGHFWHRPTQRMIFPSGGAINRDIDTTALIWTFFSNYRRTPDADAD